MTTVAIAIAIFALLGWRLHVRSLRSDLAQISAELDAAHLAGATLVANRKDLSWQHRVRVALRIANQNTDEADHLRTDLHLARLQLAEARQAFDTALAPLRESRSEAILDRDAHAQRCVELTRRVTELERGECANLHLYADGELDVDQHDAFLSHLARCELCSAELIEINQLNARLSQMPGRQS